MKRPLAIRRIRVLIAPSREKWHARLDSNQRPSV